MKINCRKKIVTDSKKDAIVIPIYKNITFLKTIIGKNVDQEIYKFITSDYFQFEEKEIKSFYIKISKKLKKVYIVYIPKDKEDIKFYMELGAQTARILRKDNITSFSLISIEDIYNEKKDFSYTKGFLEGLMFNDYIFNSHKSKKSSTELFDEVEVITNMAKLKKFIDENSPEWINTFENINIMKDLINTPANYLTPSIFSDLIKDKSLKNMTVEIFDEEQIKANNLNLVEAVGRGSSNPSRFVHIKYNGNPNSDQNIALVGKGVTFDSGGSSLKPAEYMMTMKTDMSGAALMFTVTRLIALMELPVNINTYIPLVENIIGGNALRPGDVIKSASGKTVEIMNTDAEGRLILADALYTATKTDPEIIIDAATLTGACVVALGPYCAGLFSNRKFLSKQLSDISWETSEDIWELPLYGDYEKGIDSYVADIQNMSSFGREGGSIHAALFLKQFVDNYPWVHLDIAGPAYMEKNHPIFGKEASGFGLRLLYNFIKNNYTSNTK